ncbi:MAG TPA: ATPase, T2SS/T4P/T4SS family [Acidobacteriota bacterium]|nr:ATPase, T2SS/T4P/T4SS family [Acidobacteriota bacterium]
MGEEYVIQCYSCLGEYDAISSVWCSCDPRNPTKLCPYCLQCFCNAGEEYKTRFWQYAPAELLAERASLRKVKDRLGELLVRAGLISVEDLLTALAVQCETGEKLGQVLVTRKFISQNELDLFLQIQGLIVPPEFGDETVDRESLQRLNPEFCLQRRILPLQVFRGDKRNFLILAMVNPQDTATIETVSRKLEAAVVPFFGDEFAMITFLKKSVPPGGARILEQESSDYQAVIRRMIIDAIRRHASDIHIEPDQSDVNVRYRIDGVLYKVKSPPKEDQTQLITSLKKLAKMDLDSSRIPQSSKMVLRLGEQKFQLNTLSFPNPHGESISIKIVNLSTFLRDMDEIGLSDHQLHRIKESLDAHTGLILISGPLMNGVSTTQYAMMKYLSGSSRKVMTLESPIFSSVKNIHQSEINPAVGFDFITGLNSIVRSDPDVVFLSDIPDAEVAATVCRIASRCVGAATLNAVSAASTIVLLRELGASPSLLSQVLSLVVNQRLIRRICPHCSEKSPVSVSLLMRMGLTKQEADGLSAYAGAGCKECNFIGFNGRIAIFEVLECNPRITEVIGKDPSARDIERVAVKAGMVTLRATCLRNINEGVTTIEEFQKAKL